MVYPARRTKKDITLYFACQKKTCFFCKWDHIWFVRNALAGSPSLSINQFICKKRDGQINNSQVGTTFRQIGMLFGRHMIDYIEWVTVCERLLADNGYDKLKWRMFGKG